MNDALKSTNYYVFQGGDLSFGIWDETTEKYATALYKNENICRFITIKDKFSDEDIAQRLYTEKANYIKTGLQYFPVFLTKTGDFIGICGLRPYSSIENAFELGFYFLEEYQGKGYAYKAATETMKYAETEHGIRVFMAGHHPQNKASKGLLTKLGFEHVGEELFPPTGLIHPLYKRVVK